MDRALGETAGTESVETLATKLAEEGFRQNAPGRIASAEKQDVERPMGHVAGFQPLVVSPLGPGLRASMMAEAT